MGGKGGREGSHPCIAAGGARARPCAHGMPQRGVHGMLQGAHLHVRYACLQVRTYVNGTLYSVLVRASLKERAQELGLAESLDALIEHSDETFARQISYILEQLAAPPAAEEDDAQSGGDDGDDEEEPEEEEEEEEDGEADEEEARRLPPAPPCSPLLPSAPLCSPLLPVGRARGHGAPLALPPKLLSPTPDVPPSPSAPCSTCLPTVGRRLAPSPLSPMLCLPVRVGRRLRRSAAGR